MSNDDRSNHEVVSKPKTRIVIRGKYYVLGEQGGKTEAQYFFNEQADDGQKGGAKI